MASSSRAHSPERPSAPSNIDPRGYNDRIQKIEEQYQAAVSLANDLEAYLLERYESARQADEAYLQEMDELYTVMWRKTGLPMKASRLSLDRTKLQPLGLLNSKALVAHFQRDQDRELGPPQTLVFMDASEENKGYYKLTAASLARQRSPVRKEEESGGTLARSMTWAALTQDEVETKIKEAQRRRRQMSKKMPAEQWEEEKRVLRRMRHTLNFLRNPRFQHEGRHSAKTEALEFEHGGGGSAQGSRTANLASTSGRRPGQTNSPPPSAKAGVRPGTSNTAKDDSAVAAPAAPTIKGGSLWSSAFAQRSVGLTCHPPSVEFHEFEPGKTYETTITFKNLGTISRRLRLLPPYCKYFTVGELQLPRGVEDNGLIAPGMQCTTTVTFTPDSWADVMDVITMITELGRFQIPLVAAREPPSLTMDDSVEVGACFVGHSLTKFLEVRNTGGRGRFRLEPETYARKAFPPRSGLLVHHKIGAGVRGSDLAEQLGLMLDDEDHLEPNRRERPVYAGAFTVVPAEFLLDKDETIRLEIKFEPEEVGRQRAFIKLACDNCYKNDLILKGEACEAMSFLSHIDGREPHPGELESGRPLFFGEASPGGHVERTVMIRNDAKLPVRYEWRLEMIDLLSKDEGLPSAFSVSLAPKTAEELEAQEEEGELAKFPDNFLPPKKGTKFSFSFCPTAVARLHCRASLFLSYGSEETAPCDMFCLAIELEGIGKAIPCHANPPLLFAPGQLTPGQEAVIRFALKNEATDAPARFSFPRDLIPSGISIAPMEGEIEPEGSQRVAVTVRGETIGPNEWMLQCRVQHGVTQLIPIRATVVGTPVKVGSAAVNFGLVQVFSRPTAQLRLTNLSNVSTASYRLEVCAPPPHHPSYHHRQCQFELFNVSLTPEQGTLGPSESIDVDISCYPRMCGAHRALLVVHVDGCRPKYVTLRADVLEPALALDSDVIDLGTAFVGIEQKITFWLKNLTQLPVEFEWDRQLLGDTDHMRTSISPMSGVVKPGGSYRLKLTLVPTKAANFEIRALCHVKGAFSPLALTVRAAVQGLAVSFSIVKDVPSSIEFRETVLCPGPDPVFDFGNTCRVGETQTQVLYLKNNTGIEAPFVIWADTFGLRPRVGHHTNYLMALSADGSVTRAGNGGYPVTMHGTNQRAMSPRNTLRSPMGAGPTGRNSVAPPGSRILLGDDQEQRGPFRSDLGKTMVKLRQQQQESESVLGSGTGLAIEISPSEGVIPPFKDCYIRVTCHTNMYGTYTDTLLCAIGDLEAKKLPLKIGVIGTPLVLHKNRRLIRGLPSQPLHDQTAISLQFSDAVFGASIDARTFYVFNTSPMEMEVEWDILRTIIHKDLPQDVDYVQVNTRSALGVLSVDLDPFDYTEGRLPMMFSVEPVSARIPGGGSASFTARFVPPKRDDLQHVPGCRVAETPEVQHWGMLVGRQKLITGRMPRSSIPEGELKLVTWTHGTRASHIQATRTHSAASGGVPATSGVTIEELPEEEQKEVEADAAALTAEGGEMEEGKAEGQAEESEQQGEEETPPAPVEEDGVPLEARAAASTEEAGAVIDRAESGVAASTSHSRPPSQRPMPRKVSIASQPPEEPRVQCILRGSMHPFAGPPDVPLQPLRVALMARNIGCRLVPAETGLGRLKFTVHANLPSTHPMFTHAATFTNNLQIPMVVAVSAKGELSPFSILETTPSAPQDSVADLTVLTPEGHVKTGAFVPARENVEVTVRFSEPEELEQSVKDYTLHGHLQMVYKNGDIQRFPLEAEVIHSEIQLARKDIEFGTVHVRAPKSIRVVLTNPTKADCRWEAVEKDQKPRFKECPDAVARIGPFVVRPSGGLIPGRGLGMPKTQEITVTYEPSAAKFEDREISFAVYKGRPADLYASGEGSFDEQVENFIS